MNVVKGIVVFVLALAVYLFIVGAIAQWLWSIFCPVFGWQEMTFWQMISFLVFIGIFVAPNFINKQ